MKIVTLKIKNYRAFENLEVKDIFLPFVSLLEPMVRANQVFLIYSDFYAMPSKIILAKPFRFEAVIKKLSLEVKKEKT
jgi:hypothetical protein